MNKSELVLENIFSMTRFVETAIASLELKTVYNVSFGCYNNVSIMVGPEEIKSKEGCKIIKSSDHTFYEYEFNGINFSAVEVDIRC